MNAQHIPTEPREEAVPVNFDQFAREWESGADEREANRALCNSHFDRHFASRPKPWEL